LPGSPEMFDSVIRRGRSQLGKPYAFAKVFRLGVRMALGIWPSDVRRHITPNTAIPILGFQLIEVV
jgi:hypothetical protein